MLWDRDPWGDGRLDIHGGVIAANEVAIGRHQGIAPQRHAASRNTSQVKPDIHPLAQDDVSVFGSSE